MVIDSNNILTCWTLLLSILWASSRRVKFITTIGPKVQHLPSMIGLKMRQFFHFPSPNRMGLTFWGDLIHHVDNPFAPT